MSATRRRRSCADQHGGRGVPADITELSGDEGDIVTEYLALGRLTPNLLDCLVHVVQPVEIAL